MVSTTMTLPSCYQSRTPRPLFKGQKVKSEISIFSEYCRTLNERTSWFTKADLHRCLKSIHAKGHGFIRDLDDLANDLRLALSTGLLVLNEHIRCVFHTSSSTGLPYFLGVGLAQIFDRDGVLREDFDETIVSEILSLCSVLKRTDPPASSRPALEDKVWSTLRLNFSDASQAYDKFWTSMDCEVFSGIATQARHRFHERLLRMRTPKELAYPPGANLDRINKLTHMDWVISNQIRVPRLVQRTFRWIRRQCNFQPALSAMSGKSHELWGLPPNAPFEYKDNSHISSVSFPRGKTVLKLYNNLMKCSAQPKSYKAFRGVGVMAATRMMLQLAYQRQFYKDCLDDNLPLHDQSVMYRNLSKNFEYVGTIDLSSASDRCYWPILDFFGEGSRMYDEMKSIRTEELILPDGRIDCLAPVMGEAITFVIMSNLFVSIALSVCDYYGWGHDMVAVYGDDIQTPFYEETIKTLELIGAQVNKTKSYPPESRFKESCEAHFVGHFTHSELKYVRPAYIPSGTLTKRNRFPSDYTLKALFLARDAYKSSPLFSEAIANAIERHTSLRLPSVSFRSDQLGRVGDESEDRTLVLRYKRKRSDQDLSYSGHLRNLLRGAPSSSVDKHVHLKRRRSLMLQDICSISTTREDLRKFDCTVMISFLHSYNLNVSPQYAVHLGRAMVALDNNNVNDSYSICIGVLSSDTALESAFSSYLSALIGRLSRR